MNYLIYLRKSSESKDRQTLSLSAQKRVLMEIVEKEHLHVVGVFDESKSALKPGRPEFTKAIKMIESGKADAMLVWDINRISRNPQDSGYITQLMQDGLLKEIKTSSGIYLPGDNALPLALNFALSNESSLALSKVVRRGNKEKLEQGGWPNKAPLGYINDKNVKKCVINKKEAKYIKKAFELYASGNYSVQNIADILYKDGLRSKANKKVSHSNIHLILQKTFYFGLMEWHGKFYKGKHEAIISKKLFDQCTEVRLGVNRAKPQEKKKLVFPLRGLFSCDLCGCMITAEKQKGIDYYHCTNGKKICNQKKHFLRGDELENEIVEELKTIQFDDELIDILYTASLERFNNEIKDNGVIQKGLEAELQALKTRESKLLDAMLDTTISKEVYEKKSKELQLEIFDLERRIDESEVNLEKELATFELTKKAFKAFNFNNISFSEYNSEKKSQTLKKLLSNSTLKYENGAKTLNLQYKKPYNIIAKASHMDLCPELLPD